jgi:lysophospholipase L1-like esterase
VFYGTSIVQGGCAARSGMAYPAILGRWLDVTTINLGFSGNGPMDLELAPLLAELDASVYVLDSLPNMDADLVAQRAVPFVETLRRRARPGTPIVLVENIIYQFALNLDSPERRQKNDRLRDAHQRLIAAGVKDLHYIPEDDLLGDDWEATVDGTHPTDVGFLRMAEAILPTLKPLVCAQR